jgi:AcrR family transcriptional regulator
MQFIIRKIIQNYFCMGTKERRQREVSEREQRFLEKARELIVQDGLLNLQMARVAEACDYATGTFY